ncbi:MAG: hypothetical protein M3065_12485 [Actinomycetota bacterium]|nr:hypothetical protein [Actinomycetota bacterium]
MAEHGRPFWIDADGEYRRADAVTDAVLTSEAVVFTAPIRDALGDLPAVDLAVAYGVPASGAPGLGARLEIAVAAVTVTTWYRPLTGPLRAAGIPRPGKGRRAWYRDRALDAYRPLTEKVRAELAGSAT